MQVRAHATRRSVLAFAGAAGLAGSLPSVAGADAGRDFPETIALPDGFRPEGITSGPGTTFYVGSLADGAIRIGNLWTGRSRTLVPGVLGRSLRGLYYEPGSGVLWAVGSLGDHGHIWAVDPVQGRVISDVIVPGAAFLNDIVVRRRRVWVTDSRLVPDRLTVLDLDANGRPRGDAPRFRRLRGAWPQGDGVNVNANGIRALNDGTLLLVNSLVGGLWRADPATGVTREVPVSGGPGISAGDGLLVEGRTAYVVRGSGEEEVSVLRLTRRLDTWSAAWVGRRRAPSLDVPSTATVAGGWLWAVNARFGVADPDSASYWITRLRP